MGGFTLYEDTSTISDCRQYTLVRVMSGTSGMMSCTNDVPCSGVDLITMGDVLNALAHPDVVAAFAAGTLYGRDNRAADGQVFSIVRGTTAGFLVGDPCDGDPSCLPIPPGVETLIVLL